ncbi:extracellular tyrosine-protein kinase PKDCC-like [Branchiostoma floridae x Branchiostoma japonicum]
MVRCRGRLFRRSKVGVFCTLLVVFVLVSMFLNWSSWKHRLRLVEEDTTRDHQPRRNDVNVTEEVQPDKLLEQKAIQIQVLRNMTKMINVSEDAVGSMVSKPQPMATVEPVEHEAKLLSCEDIAEISITRLLGRGYTKVVELGTYRGRQVAVKRVKSNVRDVTACKARMKGKRQHECYLFANYKIMKEMLLQMHLSHPNIVKLLGYCVRSENIAESLSEHGVVAVTEVGRSFNIEAARSMMWRQRLQIAIDIADLLDYLEHSPLGSLIMADMGPSQFVWVGDKVKLSDMDDVSSVEQACAVDSDCYIGHIRNLTPCVDGVCRGLNAKHNMNGAFRRIFQHILVHGGGEILSLTQEMENLSVSAATLHSRLKQLLQQER